MDDVAASTPNPYAQPGEHPRIDELLDFWARWMRHGGMDELHVKAIGFWSHGNSDFDGMVEAADSADAQVTNAAIEDLPFVEKVSIHHMHLNAVWRSNREPMDVVYRRARMGLSDGLKRRQVT